MKTFADFIGDTMHSKRVTFRSHGKNGELRKPMVHRFRVKGGISLLELMVQNVTNCNSLFQRLVKK